MRALPCLALLAVAAFPASAMAASAPANQIYLDFNQDAWRAAWNHAVGSGPLHLDTGWLHHQDNGDAVHLGLLVTGETSSAPGMTGGLGGRVFLLDAEGGDGEGYGVGLGGALRYVLPRYDRFAMEIEGWFAPDVLTGGDAEGYRDLGARLEYSVTRQAGVYVGARYVRGDYEDGGDRYFDTGMNIGIHLQF